MTGKICGTGSWVPDKVWDNNDLARMVETSDAWIRERTGVVQRHIAKENEDTVTMAARAAQKALEDAGMKAEEIDLIIVATISPTEIMPCVACGVQEQIGAENATCFDLNGACTGSLLALNTAQAYLAQGIYRSALVIGAEKLSGLTDWTDRGNACVGERIRRDTCMWNRSMCCSSREHFKWLYRARSRNTSSRRKSSD